MKQYFLMSVLLVSMFLCPAVISQEFELEDMEIQMQMKEREMELQRLELKMGMEREMQNLELEQRRMELENARQDDDYDDEDGEESLGLLLGICVIVHILLAIWVYMDIRKLNRGSGIWIVIVLLAGLLGALVYAVVRLGDGRQKDS